MPRPFSKVYQYKIGMVLCFKCKPSLCPICDLYQEQHNRHLSQNANRGSQRCRRCSTKQSDCHSNSQFKEIGCSDHSCGSRNIKRQPHCFRYAICNGENKKCLYYEWHCDKKKLTLYIKIRPNVSLRCNGRLPYGLPIDLSAPRPSSINHPVLFSTFKSSL